MNLHEDSEHRASQLSLRIKLALAMAIIRSKPIGLSGGEYAAQLSLSYQKNNLNKFNAIKTCSHLVPLIRHILDNKNLNPTNHNALFNMAFPGEKQNNYLNPTNYTEHSNLTDKASVLFNMTFSGEKQIINTNSMNGICDFNSDCNLLNICSVALNTMDLNADNNNNNNYNSPTFELILNHLFDIILKNELSKECLLKLQKLLILIGGCSVASKRQIVIDFFNRLLLKFVDMNEPQSEIKERILQITIFLMQINQLNFVDILELILKIVLEFKERLLIAELTRNSVGIHIIENIGILLQSTYCFIENLLSLFSGDNETRNITTLYNYYITRENNINLTLASISQSVDLISEFNPLFVMAFCQMNFIVNKLCDSIKVYYL